MNCNSGQINENPAEAARILEQAQGEEAKKNLKINGSKSVAKSKTDLEIEVLLKENRDLLNNFDQNKDGKIDHTELRLAVQAKIWAERAIKKNLLRMVLLWSKGSMGPNT